MSSIFFQATRLPRAAVRRAVFTPAANVSRRYAHQSYGNEQSGQPGSDNTDVPLKKAEKEHPGPPPPDTGSSKSSSSGSQQQSSSSFKEAGNKNPPASSGGGQGSKTKSGSRPAIHEPGPAPEEQSEEVKQHNKEMSERYEKTENQIGKDYKVDKGYWKENTGN